MIIELDIEENDNINEYESRVFMGRGKAFKISKILYQPENGTPFEADVIGWEDEKPMQAFAIRVEDSGDGEAWLVYGGNQGIRLRRSSSGSAGRPFSLENQDEWGEKYLYYSSSLYENAIQPYLKENQFKST